MLHLHHADELEPLLDALESVLRKSPADPFTPEVVVVPAVGMRDAVTAGLADRLGVAANIDFLFPGRFLARALGDPSPELGEEGDPWQLPNLAWSVLAELATGDHAVPGMPEPVDRHVTDGWRLARRIADAFDRYATQRAPLIVAWAGGSDGDSIPGFDDTHGLLPEALRWQPTLWRAVSARIGRPNPVEQLAASVTSLRAGKVESRLPDRVCIFGVGSLAPTLMQVLEALADRHQVHLFLRHPSRTLWKGPGPALGDRLVPRGPSDGVAPAIHPLLASWGRAAMETAARWHGLASEEACSKADAAAPTTVLAALRRGIQNDQPPAPVTGLVADSSLRLHACHGLTRQLEVLRDALGHLFAQDSTLQPHEVLVLCPDVNAVAPLVEPVFQRGTLPVPVAIGDRGLTTGEPAVETLSAALSLVAGRATLSELLAFVELAPVQRRFGWGPEHTEQLAEWATALGACWGLDAEHRTAWHLPDTVHEGTWRTVVDQMLAGVACAAPAPRVVVGNIAPFDEISTDAYGVVGGIADLLERVLHLHREVQGNRPIADWLDLLRRVTDDFCTFDPRRPEARATVLRALAGIEDAARTAIDPEKTCDVPLALDDVRALLEGHLTDHAGKVPLRAGAVTVTSMLPLHGVSARVVCIVGLDDGALRSGTFDNDDVLGLRPCVGERHPRHESRQLLLDAVLAAREHLIITCNGADVTTNAETPFTVPLQELLDVVHILLPSDTGTVVVHHPRHGFDESALRPGGLVVGDEKAFTFDEAMLDAAVAKRSAITGEPREWKLAPASVERIDLDDLAAVVTNPGKVLVSTRLDMSLAEQESATSDGLLLAANGLTSFTLMRELLDAHRNQLDTRDWFRAAAARGGMPPAQLGQQVLDTLSGRVDALIECANVWDVPLRGLDEVRTEIVLHPDFGRLDSDPVTLQTHLRGIQLRGTNTRVVALEPKRIKIIDSLALAVRAATLQLHLPEVPCSGVHVGFDDNWKPKGMAVRFRGTTTERVQHARRFLTTITELWEWSMRDAVPIFAQTSFHLAEGHLATAARCLDGDLEHDAHGQLLWPELSFDELLKLRVDPEDPPALRALAEANHSNGRATLAAQWLWGTYHECAEAIDANGNPDEEVADESEDDEP